MDDDRRAERDEPGDSGDLPEHVEAILDATECLSDPDHKYPIRREELATRHADRLMDLPNETESLGSVFDRLVDRRYDSPAAAREAVLNELTGEEGDETEFNDERSIARLAEDTSATGAVEGEETATDSGTGAGTGLETGPGPGTEPGAASGEDARGRAVEGESEAEEESDTPPEDGTDGGE